MADKTYQKTIPGTKTLLHISRLIHQEELEGLSTFKSSAIAVVGVTAVNLVTFEEVGVANVPGDCVVATSTDQQPGGSTKDWTGLMIFSGQIGMASLYRLP
jgi:hypothetical protein